VKRTRLAAWIGMSPLGLVLALWLAGSVRADTPAVRAAAPLAAGAQCLRADAGAPLAVHSAYLPTASTDVLALFAPPPAADSAAQRADLQAVLAAQRTARLPGHEAQRARAIADAQPNCERLADALGGAPEAAHEALRFVTRAATEASRFVALPKQYWHRPRPFVLSPRVERLADVAPGAPLPEDPAAGQQYREQRDHTSYPSGHATFGMACGILLARMVPERRAQLFARATAYGDSRVIVGAHFPTDVAAGRLAATAAVALMMQDACFEADFASARIALREALRLPAAPEAAAALH